MASKVVNPCLLAIALFGRFSQRQTSFVYAMFPDSTHANSIKRFDVLGFHVPSVSAESIQPSSTDVCTPFPALASYRKKKKIIPIFSHLNINS